MLLSAWATSGLPPPLQCEGGGGPLPAEATLEATAPRQECITKHSVVRLSCSIDIWTPRETPFGKQRELEQLTQPTENRGWNIALSGHLRYEQTISLLDKLKTNDSKSTPPQRITCITL